MTRSLDYTPLTAPVDGANFRAWKAERQSTPAYADGSLAGRIVLGIMITLIAVPVAAFLVVIAIGLITSPNPEAFTPTGVAGLSVGLLVVLAIVYGLVRGIRSWLSGLGTWKRWYRLERFAAANGLTFSTRDDNPTYPGSVFEGGTSSALVDHLRSRADDGLDYGTAWRITKAGNRTSSEEFAYIALRLDRVLPHIMLDAKRNRSRTAILRKEQVLSLEGDFDKHFTMYAPGGYERDALYIFTPDLMALLIDEASAFDVEIVDNWMMFHSSRLFDLEDPAVHDRVFRIADMVGAKTLRQSDGYRDHHVPGRSAIAGGGRRLRRALSASGIALAVLVVLLPFIPLIVDATTR
jgi:hypothetical protein